MIQFVSFVCWLMQPWPTVQIVVGTSLPTSTVSFLGWKAPKKRVDICTLIVQPVHCIYSLVVKLQVELSYDSFCLVNPIISILIESRASIPRWWISCLFQSNSYYIPNSLNQTERVFAVFFGCALRFRALLFRFLKMCEQLQAVAHFPPILDASGHSCAWFAHHALTSCFNMYFLRSGQLNVNHCLFL